MKNAGYCLIFSNFEYTIISLFFEINLVFNKINFFKNLKFVMFKNCF